MRYPEYLVALLIAGLPGLVLGQDPTVDRMIAAQCAQCHGTDGHAAGDIDQIAGKDTADLYKKLLDMKGEDRPEGIMDHQALGYTDEQLYRIARYYSTVPESSRDSKSEDDGEHEGEERDD
jgi:sulfide dehydrogenase cytochrome subunit